MALIVKNLTIHLIFRSFTGLYLSPGWGSSERLQMFAKIQSSLTLKLFFASFVSTHLPLVAALIYYIKNQHLEPMTTIALLLAATVAGTALCLGSLWLSLHPLRQLRAAILQFRKSRTACDMRSERRDEIGLITNAFSNLTTDLARTLETLERQATFDV